MKSSIITTAAIAVMLAGVITIVSCTHKDGVVAVPNVSFSKDIRPIFEANCAIASGCHIGASNANDHINLTDSAAYATIQSQDLVNLGTPEASLLYTEVNSGDMPQSPYSKLTPAQVNEILLWITQGAPNN
jgi:hypothetical protein